MLRVKEQMEVLQQAKETASLQRTAAFRRSMNAADQSTARELQLFYEHTMSGMNMSSMMKMLDSLSLAAEDQHVTSSLFQTTNKLRSVVDAFQGKSQERIQ